MAVKKKGEVASTGHGDGILRKRGDRLIDGKLKETWELRAFLGRDEVTGKKIVKYGTAYGSQKEAKERLQEFVKEAKRPPEEAKKGHTFAELVEMWLTDDSVPKPLKERTKFGYRQCLQTHILPEYGHLTLDEANDVRRMRAFVQTKLTVGGIRTKGQGVSPTTVRQLCMIIKAAMKYATEQGMLESNYLDMYKPPQPASVKYVNLKEVEINRLMDAMKGFEYEYECYFAINTGLRAGEIFALQWRDIDTELMTVDVNKDVAFYGNEYHYDMPKTENGIRIIVIPLDVALYMRKHKKAVAEYREALGEPLEETDLVFSDKFQQPHKIRDVHLHELCAKANVPYISFKNLRRAHGALALLNGENLQSVSRRLGHGSISITAKAYAYVMPEAERKMAERWNEQLKSISKRNYENAKLAVATIELQEKAKAKSGALLDSD